MVHLGIARIESELIHKSVCNGGELGRGIQSFQGWALDLYRDGASSADGLVLIVGGSRGASNAMKLRSSLPKEM